MKIGTQIDPLRVMRNYVISQQKQTNKGDIRGRSFHGLLGFLSLILINNLWHSGSPWPTLVCLFGLADIDLMFSANRSDFRGP